jgi:hypothetical protein
LNSKVEHKSTLSEIARKVQNMSLWSNAKMVTVYENITREIFETEVRPKNRPVVLKNAFADWPAVEAAKNSPDQLCEFIRQRANNTPANSFFAKPEVGGRFFYGDDLKSYNFDVRSASIPTLIELLLRLRDVPHAPSVYAGALPIDRHFGTLLNDHKVDLLPDFAEVRASVWLGNRTITAAHWDLPDNIAAVVCGKRRFTLFPTSQIPNLYFGPLDFTLAGQPISLVDFRAPDFARFPNFKTAVQHAEVAELGPGDAVFIPSLWVHHVESLDAIGLLVNFWWRDYALSTITPSQTMLHSLLSIRDLPKHQRDAWKIIFDHYIFQSNDDTMSHIPSDARGLYGQLTSATMEQITARLIDGLQKG